MHPNATHQGKLVCSVDHEGDIAKTCAVKWYSTIQFYDWADPKLTEKAIPFTEMVWMKNILAGVGIAAGANDGNYSGDANRIYVVVLLAPGQSDEEDIRLNVLPAAGLFNYEFR